jgi:hypothetical protein
MKIHEGHHQNRISIVGPRADSRQATSGQSHPFPRELYTNREAVREAANHDARLYHVHTVSPRCGRFLFAGRGRAMKPGYLPCNRCGKPVPPRSQVAGGIRCASCRGKHDRYVRMLAARGNAFSGTLDGDLGPEDEVLWVSATARGEDHAAQEQAIADGKALHNYRLKVASAWLAIKDHPDVWPRQREAWLRVFGTGMLGDGIYTEGQTEQKAGAEMGGISKPAVNKLIRKAFDNAGVKRFRPGHRS